MRLALVVLLLAAAPASAKPLTTPPFLSICTVGAITVTAIQTTDPVPDQAPIAVEYVNPPSHAVPFTQRVRVVGACVVVNPSLPFDASYGD